MCKKIGIDIRENYDPTIENAYFLSINIQSELTSWKDDIKIAFNWNPLTHVFKRWLIFVSGEHRGKGIGTRLEQAAEAIAYDLDAKTLIFEGIVRSSIDYWRNKKDFILDEKEHRATKVMRGL